MASDIYWQIQWKTQWDTQCPGLINQPSTLRRWHWHLCEWHEQMWNLDLETQPAGMENWVMPSNHLRWIFPFSEPRVNGPLTSWRQKLKQKQLSGIPSLALAGKLHLAVTQYPARLCAGYSKLPDRPEHAWCHFCPQHKLTAFPDDHCKIILQSTLAISHFWFKAQCWNIQQSVWRWHLWHTRNSFFPLSSVLHWNVTGIRTI